MFQLDLVVREFSMVTLNNNNDPLSPREVEVLKLLVDGLSNKQIAERLFISPVTVKTHIRHIMDKLEAADRTEAAVKAVRHNLI